MRSRSPHARAWARLSTLQPGDPVPADVYVLDYRDGTRPPWTVRAAEALPSGGRKLVIENPEHGLLGDLFAVGERVRVTVLVWPGKTLRTQPYLEGGEPGPTLCDMDQQARHVAKEGRTHA